MPAAVVGAHAVKNIFVPFSPDQEGHLPPSVNYALSLSERYDAHLTFRLFGSLYEVAYTFAPEFVGSIAAPANAEEKERMERAEKRLSQLLDATDRSYDVKALQVPLGRQIEIVGFQGRLHDLSVIEGPYGLITSSRALAEEVLFHTGRPIICVPKAAKGFRAARIMVAWDGSAPAARALNDALPFLREADHVEIVSVTNEKELARQVPGAEIAPQLMRHGVKVEVVALTPERRDVGNALRERATLAGIDMIVMGAFAHSRWRQLILGGVTDSMFAHAEIPVFMSH